MEEGRLYSKAMEQKKSYFIKVEFLGEGGIVSNTKSLNAR
jgi:hypothetical protein